MAVSFTETTDRNGGQVLTIAYSDGDQANYVVVTKDKLARYHAGVKSLIANSKDTFSEIGETAIAAMFE